MFKISMETGTEEFKQQLCNLFHDAIETVIEERKLELELPFMISKAQLAKYIFGVSTQTLDAHVINRPDFPKFKAGERLLFPRDMVMQWIRENVDHVTDLKRKKGDV